MTYYERNTTAGFPECLMMVPGDTPQPPDVRDYMRRHNHTILAFIKCGVGATNDLRRNERGLLELVAGFEGWVSTNGDGAADGYGAEYVTYPLSVAIHNAMNYEMGRIDGGTISGYLCDRLTGLGIDPNTGEFIPLATGVEP